ncbi:hypothetical protein [Qipengyuania sp.]|uniref:hypothetical protein n=1 Tax=Qipengyuania sp. TaxID=2004515 RepID=UPI003AF6B603
MILGDRLITDRDGNRYTLRLSVDVRSAILNDGNVETSVTAIRHVDDGDDIELTALVRLESFERRIAIVLPEQLPIHIDIEYFEGFAERAGGEVDPLDDIEPGDLVERAAQDLLDGAGLGEAIEAAIQRMPVPEPALGCPIKAGVSTTVGQLIHCHNRHRRIEQRSSRAWEIVKCLGVNAPGMTIKATLRTLRCWLTLDVL